MTILLGAFIGLILVAVLWQLAAPRERNRDERGRFVGDNKRTWWINEAWKRRR